MKTNNIQLIGVLGFDPEIREIAKGRLVARFSLMTKDRYVNMDGANVEDTQWHTIVAWGSVADQVHKFLRKGSCIHLQGRLVHRSYTAKDGITKRYMTEIVMSEFTLTTTIENEAEQGQSSR